MFTHQREAWQDPRMPVTGPAFQPARVEAVVIHYTAADNLIDGDPGEHASNLPAYLRAMQRDYVTNRGYSVGYNVAVDWLGGSWEIRGVDFRCAANKGHNERTFAILVLVDGNDMATTQASAAIRRLVAEVEALCKRTLTIVGHGQLRDPNAATQCPGSGLRSQVALGEFSPRWNPAPIISQPPTEEADDVSIIVTNAEPHPVYGAPGTARFLLLDSGKLRHITTLNELAARGDVVRGRWTNAQLVEAGIA